MQKCDQITNRLLDRKARRKAKAYLEINAYGKAVYCFEKLSVKEPTDIFFMASALIHRDSFNEAIKLIKKYQAHNVNMMCKSLLAACYHKLGYSDRAMAVLNTEPFVRNHNDCSSMRDDLSTKKRFENDKSAIAIMLELKGDLYEDDGENANAISCYSEALRVEIYFTRPFWKLFNQHLVPPSKIADLLASLPISSPSQQIMLNTYKTILHPWIHAENERKCMIELPRLSDMKCSICMIPKLPPKFNEAVEVLESDAEFMALIYNYPECCRICKKILSKDIYSDEVLLLYTDCLGKLRNTSEMFNLGQLQLALRPECAIPWFILGYYYFLIGEYSTAETHLNKCVTIEKDFGDSWLIFGHILYYMNMYDRAFCAYMVARKHNPRNPMTLVSLGLLCLEHPSLGENPLLCLQLAVIQAPNNPDVLNECGVVYYNNGRYDVAEKCFIRGIAIFTEFMDVENWPRYENLFTNLGFAWWKLKNYNGSIKAFKTALCLNNYTTFVSLSCVLLEMGHITLAIELLNKSLAMKPDNEIATLLLKSALEFTDWSHELGVQLNELSLEDKNTANEDLLARAKPSEIKMISALDSGFKNAGFGYLDNTTEINQSSNDVPDIGQEYHSYEVQESNHVPNNDVYITSIEDLKFDLMEQDCVYLKMQGEQASPSCTNNSKEATIRFNQPFTPSRGNLHSRKPTETSFKKILFDLIAEQAGPSNANENGMTLSNYVVTQSRENCDTEEKPETGAVDGENSDSGCNKVPDLPSTITSQPEPLLPPIK